MNNTTRREGIEALGVLVLSECLLWFFPSETTLRLLWPAIMFAFVIIFCKWLSNVISFSLHLLISLLSAAVLALYIFFSPYPVRLERELFDSTLIVVVGGLWGSFLRRVYVRFRELRSPQGVIAKVWEGHVEGEELLEEVRAALAGFPVKAPQVSS